MPEPLSVTAITASGFWGSNKSERNPNSTGTEIRTKTGDGTTSIPSGVQQEVVILSDDLGNTQGDGRFTPVPVSDDALVMVVAELQAIRELLELALT